MNAPAQFSDAVRIAHLAIEAIKAAGIHEDDPDFLTLVENETDALERLRKMLRAARYAEANAKAIGEMMDEMQERRARFTSKAETIRAIVKQTMTALDIKKLEAPDLTASLAAGKPALLIEDETAIPTQLLRVKTEPDKTAIRKSLEQGETVPGARLSDIAEPVLTVRTR